ASPIARNFAQRQLTTLLPQPGERKRPDVKSNNMATIASDLLQRHIETLVHDAAEWETLIADNIVWELAYAPSVGHPARLSGRAEVIRHVTWFRGAVDNFRFFDLLVYPITDSEGAVAEVKAEGI